MYDTFEVVKEATVGIGKEYIENRLKNNWNMGWAAILKCFVRAGKSQDEQH